MSDDRFEGGKKTQGWVGLPKYVKQVFDDHGKESLEWAILVDLLGLPKLRELYSKARKSNQGRTAAATEAP